jgi:iron(III) transport system permease protein
LAISVFLFAILAFLIVYPVVEVPLQAHASSGWAAPYVQLFHSGSFFQTWGSTLLVAAGAGVIGTVGAFVLGWIVERTDVPFRRALAGLIVLPFLAPIVVNAFGWAALGAPQVGWIARVFHAVGLNVNVDFYNVWGIMAVLGLGLLPMAYFVIRAPLASMGRDEEEAARVGGAGTFRILRSVSLPLVAPSIGTAFVLVFSTAAANFSVAGVLGLPQHVNLVTTEIYFDVNYSPPAYGYAGVYSMTLLVMLAIILIIQQRIERRAKVSSEMASGLPPEPIAVGRWRWPLAALPVLYIIVAFVLPVGAVISASLLPYWGASLSHMTLSVYRNAFTSGDLWTALWDTVILSAVGATITVVLGGLIAYLTSRFRLPGRRTMDAVASSPLGLPGIVLGLGYLLIYVNTPLYGSLDVILLVLIARFLPFSFRSVSAASTGLHASLEEAGKISGAGPIRVFTRIAFPLLRPSFLASWAICFLLFEREVDAIILLVSGSPLMATELYNMWSDGDIPTAAVYAVVLMVVAAVIVAPVMWFASRQRRTRGIFEQTQIPT